MRGTARHTLAVGGVIALGAVVIGLTGGADLAEPEAVSVIDPYPARTRVTGCAEPLVARPGVAAFRQLVLTQVGGDDDGLEVCKQIANGSGSYSDHADGRAWDWHVHADDPADAAMVEQVLDWLLRADEQGNRNAMARRFGITYIIWDHEIYRVGGDDAEWIPYTGTSDPHDTHVHFSFSVAGADRRTSWWTRRDPLEWSLPTEPVPLVFGAGQVAPVAGDWDGDGNDELGMYDIESRAFFLRAGNSPGDARFTVTAPVGPLGALPITGDWDGDGVDEVGVYEPVTGTFSFYHRDGRTARAPLRLGGVGDLPMAGDWDGDGVDDVGTYSPESHTFSLLSADATVHTVAFGGPGCTPMVGDWDGDGVDDIGLFRPADHAFLQAPHGGRGTRALTIPDLGQGRHLPIVGDWNGDGRDNHGMALAR